VADDEQRWRDEHPYRVPVAPESVSAADRARKLARGVGTGTRATARGLHSLGRGTARASRFTMVQAKRAADAEGAGESGLSRLIQLHVFNTAGDAAVAISLAGSLFFQVPSGEARDQVALFLGLTMLPFAIVAPLIGPFLDRFAHGRRWAIGATMAVRAFLCWVIASSVSSGSALVFAAALGVLVSSKAYGVTRAAAVPRLLPSGFTLVKANGRVSLSGIVGASISAPIAALASLAGSEWSLRYAFVLFVIATVAAIRLPAAVDSSEGEGEMSWRGREGSTSRRGRLRTRIPGSVAFALRANCGPWFLTGFLLMFMAFLLRDPDVRPHSAFGPGVMIGIVVGAAGIGRTLGTLAASLLRRITPALAVVLALVADTAATLVAALFYSVWTLALLGMVAGLAQALAKFSLDATIQRDIPPRVQASAFGRSDTTCQLAWVLGGFVGIALPLDPPRLGLMVAFAALAAWTAYVVSTAPRGRLRRRAAAPRAAQADVDTQPMPVQRRP
jgi:Major Facilitator Superfamily